MLLAILLAVTTPDPTISRLSGTWSCTTAASSDVVIEAKPEKSGQKLTMFARWRNVQPDSLQAPVRGAWTQTIALDADSGQWILDNVTNKGLHFRGTSSGFVRGTLEAKGLQQAGGDSWVGAERYRMQDGDTVFVHEWLMYTNDSWHVTSQALCRKI